MTGMQMRVIADKEPEVQRLQCVKWPMMQWNDPVICRVVEWMWHPQGDHIMLNDYLKQQITNADL